MKRVLYKKKQSLKNRRKIISINEYSEEKECKTHVGKRFIYVVTRGNNANISIEQPEIYIKKQLDTKKQEEKFCFRVKGSFFITRDRYTYRVDFCHTLHIDIVWKNKVFSPKSATLT